MTDIKDSLMIALVRERVLLVTGDDQVKCESDMPYHCGGPFYQETNMKKRPITKCTCTYMYVCKESSYNKDTVLQRKEMKLE